MQRQFGYAAHLSAIVHPARIFPPCTFLSVAEQIRAADMMVVAHFRATQAGEERLRMANGEQVHRLAGHAMKAKPSVDFSGYWQRHIKTS